MIVMEDGVRLIKKGDSIAMHLLGWVLAIARQIYNRLGKRSNFPTYGQFMKGYWTTLPEYVFWGPVTIFYPSAYEYPLDHTIALKHELVHAKQFRERGFWDMMAAYADDQKRWEIEREGYLTQVLDGHMSPRHAAGLLAYKYDIQDPTIAEMQQWFKERLEEHVKSRTLSRPRVLSGRYDKPGSDDPGTQ